MSGPLVSVDWLAAHRDVVVVLDASIARVTGPDGATRFEEGSAAFAAGHIPGARFADLVGSFSDPTAPFLFTCPTAPQLEAAARTVGIDDGTTIVAYDSLSGAWAARLWWVLRAYGAPRAFVLDGGLAAWCKAGHPVETGPSLPPAIPGSFIARPQLGYFVGVPEVKAIVAHPDPETALVCGLRHSEYAAGHIPGSVNVPYAGLLDAEGKLDAAKAKEAAHALALDRGHRAILYCGGGINAAGVALALTEAGFDGLTIFDGSMAEWRADPTLPLATGD